MALALSTVVVTSALTLVSSPIAAADYGCNDGQSTGNSFYGPTGDAAAVTNYSDAWRFRAQPYDE